VGLMVAVVVVGASKRDERETRESELKGKSMIGEMK